MSPSLCFICMSLYSVLSLLAFWKCSKKNAKTIQTIRQKLKSLFPLLLYHYRSWAAWTILYSISLQCPPIRIKLIGRVILPRTSWRSAVHTFLVIFQCTFHLLKVRYIIIIIPTAVRVCNWQHFLLITIVIIIPINKIINHHNQCITVVSVICPALYSWRCLIR